MISGPVEHLIRSKFSDMKECSKHQSYNIPMMIFYLLQKYKSTSVITEPAYFLLAQIWATEFLLGGGGGGGIKIFT